MKMPGKSNLLKRDKKVSTALDSNNELMDVKMPVMEGYEATKEIRKFNKTIVIIAQTAFGFKDFRENAMAAGCNDYISKPISQAAFNTMMYKHFNRK